MKADVTQPPEYVYRAPVNDEPLTGLMLLSVWSLLSVFCFVAWGAIWYGAVASYFLMINIFS